MLALRGTVYHFRKRVPERLKPAVGRSELWLSLQTSSKREAYKRGCLLYGLTQGLFGRAKDMSQDEIEQELDEYARLVVACAREEAEIERLKVAIAERRSKTDELQFLTETLNHELAVEQRLKSLTARLESVEQKSNSVGGRLKESRATTAALIGALAGGGAAAMPLPPKESPPFLENVKAFIAEKQRKADGIDPWTNQTANQAAVTFRLWVEIVGLKPVREYTKADAGHFREMLLKLPSSHGKARNGMHALEAIKLNEGLGKPTVAMKTVKRHFSAMNQYWEWLNTLGHVDNTIFTGFKFPGAKSKKKNRDDWTAEDLARLFTSDWYAPDADREGECFWFPLIALFTGMRIEEIARLRAVEDIQVKDDLPCFILQPHPDGWHPKTEAGERVVPIHAKLIELGLMRLVEKRRKAGDYRLFPKLKPQGPDQKLSAALSTLFSKHKIALGVARKTCFHSFRHTVRTILTNTGAELRDAWIDAVMGHAADEKGSEGVRTYTKRIYPKWLKKVVDAIEPEVDLTAIRGL